MAIAKKSIQDLLKTGFKEAATGVATEHLEQFIEEATKAALAGDDDVIKALKRIPGHRFIPLLGSMSGHGIGMLVELLPVGKPTRVALKQVIEHTFIGGAEGVGEAIKSHDDWKHNVDVVLNRLPAKERPISNGTDVAYCNEQGGFPGVHRVLTNPDGSAVLEKGHPTILCSQADAWAKRFPPKMRPHWTVLSYRDAKDACLGDANCPWCQASDRAQAAEQRVAAGEAKAKSDWDEDIGPRGRRLFRATAWFVERGLIRGFEGWRARDLLEQMRKRTKPIHVRELADEIAIEINDDWSRLDLTHAQRVTSLIDLVGDGEASNTTKALGVWESFRSWWARAGQGGGNYIKWILSVGLTLCLISLLTFLYALFGNPTPIHGVIWCLVSATTAFITVLLIDVLLVELITLIWDKIWPGKQTPSKAIWGIVNLFSYYGLLMSVLYIVGSSWEVRVVALILSLLASYITFANAEMYLGAKTMRERFALFQTKVMFILIGLITIVAIIAASRSTNGIGEKAPLSTIVRDVNDPNGNPLEKDVTFVLTSEGTIIRLSDLNPEVFGHLVGREEISAPFLSRNLKPRVDGYRLFGEYQAPLEWYDMAPTPWHLFIGSLVPDREYEGIRELVEKEYTKTRKGTYERRETLSVNDWPRETWVAFWFWAGMVFLVLGLVALSKWMRNWEWNSATGLPLLAVALLCFGIAAFLKWGLPPPSRSDTAVVASEPIPNAVQPSNGRVHVHAVQSPDQHRFTKEECREWRRDGLGRYADAANCPP